MSRTASRNMFIVGFGIRMTLFWCCTSAVLYEIELKIKIKQVTQIDRSTSVVALLAVVSIL